jgi:hypothetical protein
MSSAAASAYVTALSDKLQTTAAGEPIYHTIIGAQLPQQLPRNTFETHLERVRRSPLFRM